jgi:hypothetical protein
VRNQTIGYIKANVKKKKEEFFDTLQYKLEDIEYFDICTELE